MPCVLQLSLKGNLGPYVMHISCRYECTGNAIFGPVISLANLPIFSLLASQFVYVFFGEYVIYAWPAMQNYVISVILIWLQ